MKKPILIVFSSLFAAAVLAGGMFALYYFTSGINYNGAFNLSVKQKIEITRNMDGVPDISVNSMEDFYFGLGFVHAQDRMMMMEYYRAIAGAGLSGILRNDADAEVLDRIVRVSGITKKAEEIEDKLTVPYLDYLKAYVSGINSRKTKSGIKKINRPWEVTDVISIMLFREWSGSYLNNIENIFQFSDKINRNKLTSLFPDELIHFYSRDEKQKVSILRKIKSVLEKYTGKYNSGYAFFIPPNRTSGNKSMTGYSFDSSLNTYPDFYPVSVKLGDIHVKGITFSGLPFIYAGNNQNISFFGFSLNTDVNDFVIEEIKIIEGQPNFLTRRGWKKFIPVRVPVPDEGYQQKQDIIWVTDNGPVLDDIMKDQNYHGSIVTLSGFYPDESYVEALMKIPFSENIDRAADSVKNINSYPRVYLFTGPDNCSRVYSGKVPLTSAGDRIFKKGTAYNFALADITNITKTDKTTAAGSWLPDQGPFLIRQRSITDRERINRLNGLINENPHMKIENTVALLKDNYSAYAEKLVPKIVSLLSTIPITSARLSKIYFNKWNMQIDAEKVAPSIFNILVKNMMIETYEDDIGDETDTYNRVSAYNHYHYLLDKFDDLLRYGKSPVFDNTKTENVETVEMTFDRAFINSMRYLNRKLGPIMENWKWGNIHRGQYKIPLKEKSIINNLLFKIKDRPLNGGNSTLYSGAYLEDFQPILNSSLLGVFSADQSMFRMNFSYSTDPMSRFYYGKFKDELTVNFSKLNKTYKTVITPTN